MDIKEFKLKYIKEIQTVYSKFVHLNLTNEEFETIMTNNFKMMYREDISIFINFLERDLYLLDQLNNNQEEKIKEDIERSKKIKKIIEQSDDINNLFMLLKDETDEKIKTLITNKIVEDNINLVHLVISDKFRDLFEYEDLFQYGSIGLIKAVEKFDVEKGVKFSTYSYRIIKNFIQRGMYQLSSKIKVSDATYNNALRIKKIKLELISKNKENPNLEELVKISGLRISQVKDALEYLNMSGDNIKSLEEKVMLDENITIGEMIEDKSKGTNEICEEKEFINNIDNILENLDISEKHMAIMKYRYGFIDGIEHSCQDVAEIFGCTRQTISNICIKVCEKLLENPDIVEYGSLLFGKNNGEKNERRKK